ncbi:uncharacterized protein AB9W97_002351 isoform 2-T3 [Spinachia spinachia]
MSSQLSLNVPEESVCWLHEECMPEVTFLDETCSSPLPRGMPATPATHVTTGSVNSRLNSLRPPQSSSSIDLNTTTHLPSSPKKRPDLLKGCLSFPKAESEIAAKHSPQNGTEASLQESSSDVVQENNSEFHSFQLSVSNDKMPDPVEGTYRPERFMDSLYFPDITLLEATRESEPTDGAESVSMEVTQENVLESPRTSPEHSASSEVKAQTSAEDTFDAHPSNVTQDVSSSSVVTVQCAASEFSTSDMPCDSRSRSVTSELHGEPLGTSNAVEANNEELLSSHEAELTSKETQPSPEACRSVSGAITSLQTSHSSSSTPSNTTVQKPGPKNTTLDLTPSNAESEATDSATSVSKNTTGASLCINQTFPAVKATCSSDMHNSISDRNSLRISCGNTFIGNAGSGTFLVQNNTVDAKPPKQNDTITLSETSSSGGLQNTFDKAPPPGVCNLTSTPKESSSKAQTPQHEGTVPITKMVDTPERMLEVNPAVEVASGTGQCETTNRSQSSLPLTNGLCDSLGCQNMETENKMEHSFNLEESLDLTADLLITSTPMTTCKILSVTTERAQGKTIVGQKRLYVDGPALPDGPTPSNVVCDRKTFFAHPAAKSLLPPLRTASQLLRQTPGSALSGRCDASTSGPPMTRQRTQAVALRNTLDGAQATGVSSSYKLRPSTTAAWSIYSPHALPSVLTLGLKMPISGLPRPQLSGIPSGIQRPAAGLRPPSAGSNASSSSSSLSSHANRPRGPTAANPVAKTTHSKKQPLSRNETLPIAKKTRMDAASSISALARPAAAVSTRCNAVGRHKALKQPATSHGALQAKGKGHECATCVMLKQQLKQQSEEIQRLKEDLLKKS